MKACLSIFAILPTALVCGQTVVTPKIDDVDLFKNGLVILRASFPAPEPGEYVWQDPPRAVHGSFWIEGDLPIETRGGSRKVREVIGAEEATGDPQKDLAGRRVLVATEDGPNYSGTIWELPDPTDGPALTAPISSNPPFSSAMLRPWSAGSTPVPEASTGPYLVLLTGDTGRIMIPRSRIVRIETDEDFAPQERWVEKPLLRFQVGGGDEKDRRVHVSWLAHGISWAPSYRINLGKDGRMGIEQSALIRNELLDLKDTGIGLISGFPNVTFGHVDSPLWPHANLASFFSQLSGQRRGGGNPVTSQIMSNAISSYEPPAGTLPDVEESGAGSADIHIQPIGARELAKGESLAMSVARKEAAFERVVEWSVNDPRDQRGRYTRREPSDEEAPWDAVRFRNPFDFPMTTAPAMIVEQGSFRGQTRSDWVNPGQVNCLRVTKALSVRAEYQEIEEEGKREVVWIAGDDFRRTTAKATLKLHNARATPVTMSIRMEFSGELLEADRNPEKRLRTEGISSVNPRRELLWDIQLKPGEETEIGFRYSVLVDC